MKLRNLILVGVGVGVLSLGLVLMWAWMGERARVEVVFTPFKRVAMERLLREIGEAKRTYSDKKPLAQLVEENPAVNKVAHREIKVRMGDGEILKGKKVEWTYIPVPGETPATIRGGLTQCPEAYQNRFSASTTYGAYGFSLLSQEKGQTIIDDKGYTAVRVNVPPIGFNKVRIQFKLEKMAEPAKLIDMEVPAVVVIDPGHGLGTAGGSNAVGGSGVITGTLEHEFALDVATRMENSLRAKKASDKLNLKIFLTRRDTGNITFQQRTKVARDNGCDVYVSIHFNVENGVPLRRHPFGMWDITGNYNLEEDKALAIRLRQAVQGSITAIESIESKNAPTDGYTSENHEANLQKGLDTCSDSQDGTGTDYNGNIQGYTPCRAALIELEWMSNEKADVLFNGDETGTAMRQAAAEAMASAAIQDIYAQPNQ
jgi:N-acetylmuramoyl-L-alanine amidase